MHCKPLLACTLLSLVALTLPARNAGSQTAQPKRPAPAAAAAPALSSAPNPADPPAEKAFKNIKVLTGMPASQMFPVMGLMRSSLGVSCDFCHVPEKFDLDTKEEKETARQMIRMVYEINRNNFKGQTEVTCNSCHHGATRPVAVPPLAQGQVAQAERPERGSLPKVAEVLDRAIEAQGDRAALAAVQRRVSRGTVLHGKEVDAGTPKARMVNRGEEDPLEMIQEAGRLTVTITMPQGKLVETFDGTSGTVETPEGKKPMTADEVKHIADEADLHWALGLRERADKMRVVGKDTIDGHAVWVVRGATKNGRRATFYFDAENGLLVRRIVLNPTVLGADPEQTDYSDYRAVGAVKVPFVIKTSYLNDDFLGTTMKLTEVRDTPAGPGGTAKP